MDRDTYGFMGLILFLLSIFWALLITGYGYWRGLAFVKRMSPAQMEEEIQNRKEDLVEKFYAKIHLEEDKQRRREEIELRNWAIKRAEKIRLKREAKQRAKDYTKKLQAQETSVENESTSPNKPLPRKDTPTEVIECPETVSDDEGEAQMFSAVDVEKRLPDELSSLETASLSTGVTMEPTVVTRGTTSGATVEEHEHTVIDMDMSSINLENEDEIARY